MIAHVQLVDDADLDRFAALGVIPCMQPLWAQMDALMTVLTVPRLGAERADKQYRMRTLDESGAPLALGSDWPVSSGAPLDGIAIGVSRQTPEGEPEGGWTPEEILPIERALTAYTAGVAEQAFAEDGWGRLMAGASADLVWLDRDPRTTPAAGAPSAGRLGTYLRGKPVYRPRIRGEHMTTEQRSTLSPTTSVEAEGHLKRALGVPALVLFGMVYMVPLTVFTTYGIVTQLTGGRLSVAYLVTLAAMVFTARSYARMSAAFPVAGSTYAYTQRTFGAPVGFLAGWSLLLDYLFLPMLNYLVIGIYLRRRSPPCPPGCGSWSRSPLVTVLNIVGIVSVARANFLLLALQIVFIVVFVVMAFVTIIQVGNVEPDGAVHAVTARRRRDARSSRARRSCACPSSASTRCRPCRRRRRTPTRSVPKAIMIATVVCGLIFFGLVLRLAAGVPVQPVRRRRLGFAGRHAGGGRAVPQHLLHRGLRRRLRRFGADLAGVGGEDPLRDGSRRDHAAQGVRARLGAVRHADVRDPGGVGDLAGCVCGSSSTSWPRS